MSHQYEFNKDIYDFMSEKNKLTTSEVKLNYIRKGFLMKMLEINKLGV